MAARTLLAVLLALVFVTQAPAAPALVPVLVIDDCGSGHDSYWYDAARFEAPGECRGSAGGQTDGVDTLVFHAPTRVRIDVRVTSGSAGSFHFCLIDPAGAWLGCSGYSNAFVAAQKSLASQRAGDYLLRIWPGTFDPHDFYTANVTFHELPPQDDCGTGADALMWPEHASPIAFPIDCTGGFTADGLDTQDIYSYDPPDGMRVRVEATPLSANATVGLCVDRAGSYWSWGCAAWPGVGNASRLDFFPLADARYQTIVSGRPGLDYTLTMRADPIPAQSDCGAPGDASPNAPGRTLGVPVACEGTLLGGFHDWQDRYALHAEAGQDVEVRLETQGAVTACLDSPAPGPVPCATSANGLATLRQLATVAGAWTLTLSTKDDAAPYTLDVALLAPAERPQDDCGTDADAAGSEALATPVPLGASCPGALPLAASDLDDWYSFRAQPGSTLALAMAPPEGGEAEACLFEPGAAEAVFCRSASSVATFPWRSVVDSDGAWRLRLRATSGEPRYAFNVTAPATQDDCGAGRDAPGSHAAALPLALPAACEGSFEPNVRDAADWYRVQVRAGETLRAVLAAPPAFDFDVCLYAPSSTTPAACGASPLWQPETASATAREDGEWRVAVLKKSGSGAYSLRVDAARLT